MRNITQLKVINYSIWTISVILMQSKTHSGLLGTCCSLGLLNRRDIIFKQSRFLNKKKDKTLNSASTVKVVIKVVNLNLIALF